MAVDADGALLALYLEDPNRIEVYDVADEALVQSIPVNARPGRLCFLADGATIVAQAADELLHAWDLSSGVEVLTLPGSTLVEGLACSQQGARVAVATEGGHTTAYDLGPAGATQVAAAAMADPLAGSWSADGSIVVADAIGLHRLDATGDILASARETVVAGPGWIPVSNDGRFVAAGTLRDDGDDGPITLFDVGSLQRVRTMDGAGHLPLAFSADDRRLLAGGFAGSAIFDVETGRRLVDLPSTTGEPIAAVSGAFLPDGAHVIIKAVGSREASVFNVDTGAFSGTVCSSANSIRVAVDRVGGRLVIAHHQNVVEAWTLDGLLETISGGGATCSASGPNASDAKRSLTLAAPGEGGIALSPDGRWLASTTGFEGTLAVSDLRDASRGFEIEHDGEIGILGFSPDSRWLAIAYNDTRGSLDAVRIYAVQTDDLVEVARRKVTRELTAAECVTFPEATSCPAGNAR